MSNVFKLRRVVIWEFKMLFFDRMMNREVYFLNKYSGHYFEDVQSALNVVSSLEGKIMKLKQGFKLIKNAAKSTKAKVIICERGRYKGNIILKRPLDGIPFIENYKLIDYRDIDFYSKYAKR